jgi:hypothetical protein
LAATPSRSSGPSARHLTAGFALMVIAIVSDKTLAAEEEEA